MKKKNKKRKKSQEDKEFEKAVWEAFESGNYHNL